MKIRKNLWKSRENHISSNTIYERLSKSFSRHCILIRIVQRVKRASRIIFMKLISGQKKRKNLWKSRENDISSNIIHERLSKSFSRHCILIRIVQRVKRASRIIFMKLISDQKKRKNLWKSRENDISSNIIYERLSKSFSRHCILIRIVQRVKRASRIIFMKLISGQKKEKTLEISRKWYIIKYHLWKIVEVVLSTLHLDQNCSESKTC